MPAHLAGRKTAGPALALRPFDDARSTHLKYRRHRMRTLTGSNTPHRALAQIHRIGPRHRCRPPFGRQLESDSQPLGHLPPIQSGCDMLQGKKPVYSMNQPWVTTKDWPVSAFEGKAAKNSAVSAISSTVVNWPSTVSFSMTFLMTSCSVIPRG